MKQPCFHCGAFSSIIIGHQMVDNIQRSLLDVMKKTRCEAIMINL